MTRFSFVFKRSSQFFPCFVIATFSVCGFTSQAVAAADMQMSIEAPLALRNPATRGQVLADLEELHVKSVRYTLFWDKVAPAVQSDRKPSFDPTNPENGYNWSEVDPVVEEVKQRGLSLLLTITGPGPKWATISKRDGITRPNPDEYKVFVTAAAKRYGSAVSVFSLWNEPNLFSFLRPQFAGGSAASPKIYRSLVQAGLQGLNDAGYGSTTTVIGELAPGSVSMNATKRVAPLQFLRELFCLRKDYRRKGNCAKLDIDGFAIHPYIARVIPFSTSKNPDDVRIGYLTRLTKALDKAARVGAVRKGLPIYLTEFGVQSCPDRQVGVSLAQQAELLGMSERIAYENPRVKWMEQYLITDVHDLGNLQTGLRFADGRPKPSFDGFRLPLAVRESGSRVSVWGRVRPAVGQQNVTVLFADKGKGFERLRDVRTDDQGVFVFTDVKKKGRRWQLQWTDQNGVTHKGAQVRSYPKTLNKVSNYEQCK